MSECLDAQQLATLMEPEACESGNGPLREEPHQRRRIRRRSAAARVCETRRSIAAGLTLLGFALLVFATPKGRQSSPLQGAAEWATELAEVNPCEGLPHLQLLEVLHSNLGGKGPDKGEEGLIFRASAHHSGLPSRAAEVHFHALSEYQPSWPKANGIHGKFGEVNLAAGTNTTLEVYAVDPKTKEKLTLPHGTFSFFDLDHGKDGHSREYIQVGNFSHFYIANDTELEVVDHKDGSVTFRAGKEGDGDDNPDDPLRLTALQKRRTVTLHFQDLNSTSFVLGSTPGNTTRVFHFIFRPSLLCASTLLEDGTLLGALEKVPGSVVPMKDRKVSVSKSDLQRLVDEDYDCGTNTAGSSEWPVEQKTWCCDHKDVGCELLGIDEDGELGDNETVEEDENGTTTTAGTSRPDSHSGASPTAAALGAAFAALLAIADLRALWV